MKQLALELLVILGLTLVNAFFAGAEIAIVAVRKTRLKELANEGHRAARVALRLRENPDRFLATVQVGITVVGISAGAFGGAVLEQPMSTALQRVGLGHAAEEIAFALVVALISVLSIVIGELVPKSLALRHSERVALWVSRPLLLLSQVARPIVWFLTTASNLVLRPFRDQTTFTEARLSPEELQQLVDEATAAGTMNKDAGEIASRAIDLGNLKAFSMMVPRTEIAWLTLNGSREDVVQVLKDKPHARYPVLDSSQQPAGYVLAREVYAQLLEGDLDLRGAMRKIPTFPETAAAVVVLRALQEARSEIGLLVEETGSPSGLVSIETLAEELFGEILAEHEIARPSIAPQDDGSTIVRGDTSLHEINRDLGLELPINATTSTIGGLVLATYGGFPAVGDTVVLPGGIDAEVTETSARRVLLVRLHHDKRPNLTRLLTPCA